MTEAKGVQLVIIGDLAFETDHTQNGTKTSLGGSGYYACIGASRFSQNVGIIARVGTDYNLDNIVSLGVDIQGVNQLEGPSARFVVYHHSDTERTFKANRGVAKSIDVRIFPQSYKLASHIHLATSLPANYLIWIEYLRKNIGFSGVISGELFEEDVLNFPAETLASLERFDMAFMNDFEYHEISKLGLTQISIPFIMKHGKDGASFVDQKTRIDLSAPTVSVIDTSGAGEVLAGSFIAQRLLGKSVTEALKEAVNLASLSVTEFGVEHLRVVNQTLKRL